jgi:ornithine--oxo-acid transaminase
MVEEGMPENALKMGDILRDELSKIKSSIISDQRGRGLFRAIEVSKDSHVNGNDFAYILMKLGLLTKATHDYSLRLAPSLVIKEEQVKEAASIIKEGVLVLEHLHKERSTHGKHK